MIITPYFSYVHVFLKFSCAAILTCNTVVILIIYVNISDSIL